MLRPDSTSRMSRRTCGIEYSELEGKARVKDPCRIYQCLPPGSGALKFMHLSLAMKSLRLQGIHLGMQRPQRRDVPRLVQVDASDEGDFISMAEFNDKPAVQDFL